MCRRPSAARAAPAGRPLLHDRSVLRQARIADRICRRSCLHNCTPLHAASDVSDVLSTVCPWWDGPLVKARLDMQLREAAACRLNDWVWVHHAPPANSPTSWGGKRFFGDVELVQWIERHQPSMVISGHVHQSPFIPDGSWFDRLGSTWVFNTGLQPGRPPTCIVLDFDESKAFWLAAGDERFIDLKAPLQRPAARIEQPPAWLTSLGRIADPILARP